MECKWLPELLLYEEYSSWEEYEEVLYSVFNRDFKETRPIFEGKKLKYVIIRLN